ncbi:MAG: hypothetical protein AAFN12_02105 [Cyanobacteria bacterium J06560_2]
MVTNRRLFLQMGPPAIASLTLATCGAPAKNSAAKNSAAKNSAAKNSAATSSNATQPQSLAPTPACGEDAFTPSQTAGPFYTPDSPERSSLLEPGISGTSMLLTGQVLSQSCEPIANALLDFWHTDDQGDYDNRGYRLRGHQFTDAQGRYRLETIVPGIYPGRTRHFHVKVSASSRVSNKSPLTTQLYFPEEPLNNRDGLFHPELLISIASSETTDQAEKQAVFDFVLSV